MSQRDYSQFYTIGRFCLQILQDGQHDGIAIELLPRLAIGINKRMLFVVGLGWVVGDVNIGIMTAEFAENERKRRQLVIDNAAKQGLTPRQYLLRWGW